MLVSRNVFHVVSALQSIVFIQYYWLIRSLVDPTLQHLSYAVLCSYLVLQILQLLQLLLVFRHYNYYRDKILLPSHCKGTQTRTHNRTTTGTSAATTGYYGFHNYYRYYSNYTYYRFYSYYKFYRHY